LILLRPVPTNHRITQLFGENPALYPTTKGHNGIDYGLPEGVAVQAAAAGQVIRAELDTETARNPKAGYGIHVRIQHPNGWQTIYGHLSGLTVSTGQHIRMGEQIGTSGNTGRSTGPHLHFELRTDVAAVRAIDPAPFIVDAMPRGGGLFRAEITKEGDYLNVRTGPSKTRGKVRSLRAGEQVMVIGVAGVDVWLRIPDGYVLFNPEWLKVV
jgi:hypothetical protein